MKAKRIIGLLLLFSFGSAILLTSYITFITFKKQLQLIHNELRLTSERTSLILEKQGSVAAIPSSYSPSCLDLTVSLIAFNRERTAVLRRNISEHEADAVIRAFKEQAWASESFHEWNNSIVYVSASSNSDIVLVHAISRNDILRSVADTPMHVMLAIAILVLLNVAGLYFFIKTHIEDPLKNLIENRIQSIMQSLTGTTHSLPADFSLNVGFLTSELKNSLEKTMNILYAWARGKRLFEEFSNIALAETDSRNIFRIMHSMVADQMGIKRTQVYEISNSTNRIELLYSSTEDAKSGLSLDHPDLCFAFRSGHPLFQSVDKKVCSHCPKGDGETILCMPLIAGATAIGICQFSFDTTDLYSTADYQERPLLHERFLSNFVRLAGTALNGLKLLNAYKNQAITDSLTGLYNRRYIVEYMTNMINISKRSSDPMAVLMIDIDHFKRFNDEYGHKIGDLVLREVAGCIRRTVREGDVAGRYGGEEFVCILPGSDMHIALDVAERIRSSVKMIEYDERIGMANIPRITLSIGIAQFPLHGYSHYHLTNAADRALYRAKTEGRDRVRVHAHIPEHEEG